MLSKIIKLSTSIWINNNKEKVTVLKFWITVSLNVGFGREGQWDYESWLRALVHAQSHLPLPPNQDKKSVVITALQGGVQGGTGHHHPELVAQLSVVSGWLSGVLLSTFNFSTKQIQALGGSTICSLGQQLMGRKTDFPAQAGPPPPPYHFALDMYIIKPGLPFTLWWQQEYYQQERCLVSTLFKYKSHWETISYCQLRLNQTVFCTVFWTPYWDQ